MDINAVDSGSRVTRSLRKRLTSIDDTSSRPGTPLSTKLTSITEISASPSKSTRSTRRNSVSSVSTPVKTPAKRGVSSSVISENSESALAVRKARKRSVLTNDNDEIPQASIQISTNDELADGIVQSDENPTITTRSKSISPQQEKNSTGSSSPKKAKVSSDDKPRELEVNTKSLSAKKRKPGPKSKTCESTGVYDMSDVEVSVLEDRITDVENKSPNVTTVVLIDDDSGQTSNMKKNDFEENKKGLNPSSELVNNDAVSISINTLSVGEKIQDIERNTDKQIDEKNIGCQEITSEPVNKSQYEKIENDEQKADDNEQKELIREHDMSEEKKTVGGDNFGDINKDNDNKNSNDGKTSDEKKTELSKGNSCDKHELACNKTSNNSQTPEIKKTPEKCEVLSLTTTTPNDCKDIQKKVDFIPSPSDETSMKTVYPKTPASTKANITCKKFKCYLENLDMELIKNNKIVKNGRDAGLQIALAKSPKGGCESPHTSEIDQSSTPTNKQNLKTLDDDKNEVISETTPIGTKSCAEKEIDVQTKSEDENYSKHSQNENENGLKWTNPSTKGETGEGSKLDMVSANTNASDVNTEDKIAQNETDIQKLEFSSDDEAEVEEDENDCYEKEYERKNDFIDDETVEVENYESGDSMDSEERREIEMNQIPIDEYSIGSQNTEDDECVEDDNSLNSFIVSDNGNMENSVTEYNEDEELDEYVIESKDKKNKKFFRRIQCQIESSSSSDEVEEENPETCRKGGDGVDSPNSVQDTFGIQNKQKEISKSVVGEESDLEKESLNLKCKEQTVESLSEENPLNKSSNSINLDTSKLSDSALRLHYASYSKSEEEYNQEETNISRKEILSNYKQSLRLNKSFRDLDLEIDEPASEDYDTSKVTVAESNDNAENKNSSPEEKCIQTESQLGEVSATSENEGDQENKNNKSLNLSNDCKSGSVSIENTKNRKQIIECQKSFTIDVPLKNREIETKLADPKSRESKMVDLSPVCSQEKEQLENMGTEYLENMKRQMPLPLGNPLMRTRRQSLALPANPDMEICSSHAEINKKTERKSTGVLSNIDLNPSQSFVESMELLRNEQNKLSAKRKRLSKSFGGSTDANDYSIADINACHLRKRSKLMNESSLEESDEESVEQISTSKIFKQISSTPHEKIGKNDSFNRRILTRCDEILETANRAKLEAKIRNKKKKIKTVRKSKKKPVVTSSEDTSAIDKDLTSFPVKIKRKDITKTVISQAFKAADAILNKPTLNKIRSVEKSLEPDVTEAIQKTAATKKKSVKETNQPREKFENICATSAGNFKEIPQTPEKKKKIKYIQLPTGKVSVEPVTPKKSSTQALKGRPFRESPLTPCAFGVRSKKINSSESLSTIARTGKRKRYQVETVKNITGAKAQWTQSGLFREEVLSNRSAASKKIKPKERQQGNQCSVHQNFKENALSRPDINRGTKRELLMIKERKRACGTINNNI